MTRFNDTPASADPETPQPRHRLRRAARALLISLGWFVAVAGGAAALAFAMLLWGPRPDVLADVLERAKPWLAIWRLGA